MTEPTDDGVAALEAAARDAARAPGGATFARLVAAAGAVSPDSPARPIADEIAALATPFVDAPSVPAAVVDGLALLADESRRRARR